MYDFAVEKPTTVSDAVDALKQEDVQLIAGGQTLIPTMKSRLAAPSKLISVVDIENLNEISKNQKQLGIGAATTHAEVANELEGQFPALASLAGNIGDPAVRSRGTIGGSLANNDPAACYPSAVLACNAIIRTDSRDIPADKFFNGMFETALNEGELITEVLFPVPDLANYQKFEQPASRFALVGVFVAAYDKLVRVAVTGASDSGVYRWTEAEEVLRGNLNADALNDLEVPSEGMISDVHGSQEYRANLVKVLTKRAVKNLA